MSDVATVVEESLVESLGRRLAEVDTAIAMHRARLAAIPAELHEARLERERRSLLPRRRDVVDELEREERKLEASLAELERDREAVVQLLAAAGADERARVYDEEVLAQVRECLDMIAGSTGVACDLFAGIGAQWVRIVEAANDLKALRLRALNEFSDAYSESDFVPPLAAMPVDLPTFLVLMYEHAMAREGEAARGRDPFLRQRLRDLRHLREMRIPPGQPLRSFAKRMFTHGGNS